MDPQSRAGVVEEDADTTMHRFDMGERFPEIAEEVTGISPIRLLGNLESVIQRYPWPTLLVGIGIGYLVARQMR